MQLRCVVLATLLVSAPSLAAAQQAVASSDTAAPQPSLAVRFEWSPIEESPTPEPASYLSAPATNAMSRRSPWLIPGVGAAVGAGALTGLVVYECGAMSEGCMIPPALPLLVGGAAGGLAGLLVKWTVQGFERMKQAPSQPGA